MKHIYPVNIYHLGPRQKEKTYFRNMHWLELCFDAAFQSCLFIISINLDVAIGINT